MHQHADPFRQQGAEQKQRPDDNSAAKQATNEIGGQGGVATPACDHTADSENGDSQTQRLNDAGSGRLLRRLCGQVPRFCFVPVCIGTPQYGAQEIKNQRGFQGGDRGGIDCEPACICLCDGEADEHV